MDHVSSAHSREWSWRLCQASKRGHDSQVVASQLVTLEEGGSVLWCFMHPDLHRAATQSPTSVQKRSFCCLEMPKWAGCVLLASLGKILYGGFDRQKWIYVHISQRAPQMFWSVYACVYKTSPLVIIDRHLEYLFNVWSYSRCGLACVMIYRSLCLSFSVSNRYQGLLRKIVRAAFSSVRKFSKRREGILPGLLYDLWSEQVRRVRICRLRLRYS